MTRALIIIDMLARDVHKLYNRKTILKNQVALMRAFTERMEKVILVGGPKSGVPRKKLNPVMRKLWGNENSQDPSKNKVIPALLGEHFDLYIDKPEYSAFFKTKLAQYCKQNKINELYFCGIYAGCCVYFSAADAAMRGIQPYLVIDAVASPSPKRTKMNADNFKTFIGPVVKTSELIRM